LNQQLQTALVPSVFYFLYGITKNKTG